jgi:hypothetical protein
VRERCSNLRALLTDSPTRCHALSRVVEAVADSIRCPIWTLSSS